MLQRFSGELTIILFAAIIFLGTIPSPPSLMDDVDAAFAQIARTMLESGDWITPHLNGVPDMEKPPLEFWLVAISFRIFGVHDWAARIPTALAAILLCWLTARIGTWAFGPRSGFYAGLILATCVGLFLFTRILIPDPIVTLSVTAALWSFLRSLDPDEPRPHLWAFLMAAGVGLGLLAKGLLALIIVGGAGVAYLLLTHQLSCRATWARLRPIIGLGVILAIAAPWHVLATLRNPPYFAFTLRSGPGQYHGFLWFYLINEHILRFLNLRYPHDYDTVPRLYFWLLHLVWLFPWSGFFPGVVKLSYRPENRAGKTRLLVLCWIGFLLVFLSFSTTQEYYSMPIYPALALLLGPALVESDRWIRRGKRLVSVLTGAAAVVTAVLLGWVRSIPTPGDISSALMYNPEAYRLSLGHMSDLTIRSLAYLRTPLALAGLAFLLGAIAAWRFSAQRAFLALALMMALLAHAARFAMVAFDPYLSSRPLAQALQRAPEGQLIIGGEYFAFSSVFFYTNRRVLILNGRVNDLEYGSYAPETPAVFIDDAQFQKLWRKPERCYLIAAQSFEPRLGRIIGPSGLHVVVASGGKLLLTNHESRPQ